MSQKELSTVDGGGAESPKSRGSRIRSASDVKRFLARAMREGYAGQLDTDVGRVIGYLSTCWLKANELAKLDAEPQDKVVHVKYDFDDLPIEILKILAEEDDADGADLEIFRADDGR